MSFNLFSQSESGISFARNTSIDRKRQRDLRLQKMRESKRLKQLTADQDDSTVTQNNGNFTFSTNENALNDITNASVTPKRTPTSRMNGQRERAAVATASGKKVRELTEEVEKLQKKVDDLTEIHAHDMWRIKEMADEIKKLRKKLDSRPEEQKNRKKVEEYRSPGYQKNIIKKLETEKLGESFKIVPKDGEMEKKISDDDAIALRAAAGLTDDQYRKCQMLSGKEWPKLYAMRDLEDKRVEAAGGVSNFEYVNSEGRKIPMIWRTEPAKVFEAYVKSLAKNTWNGVIPSELHLVLSGDKGGDNQAEWFKLGWSIPTNVPKPQSPTNYVVMAMYNAKEESKELVGIAGESYFNFANSIVNAGGYEMDGQWIAVKVLWVSDLKMIPVVLDVPHTSSNDFCPICVCKRKPVRAAPQFRPYRIYSDDRLLQIEPENLVIPPLHDKTQRDVMLKKTGCLVGYRQSSLMDGRNGSRFLKWAVQNPEEVPEYQAVFAALHEVQKWATAEDYAIDYDAFDALTADIEAFTTAWRRHGLPTTNKFHLLESHARDFIVTYGTWGKFGEQCLESMHHVGNILSERCFGVNTPDKARQFFMRRNFLTATSNTSQFQPKSKPNRSRLSQSSKSSQPIYEYNDDSDIDLGTILRRNLRIADLDELNGALLSLGNIIGNLEEHDLQGIVEPDTVQKIVFLAENCPHLHVRGVAFMAINLIAKSEYGTQKLIEAEWEVNRRPEMQTLYEMKKRNEHFGILESPKFEPKFQKAPKKNSSPSLSPKMRPARSDSMFMRAGNEALAALRAKKYTRRKSSSNSMSTPHTEHTHENTPSILENDLSEDTFELDAVSFDFQIMKTLNRNKDDHEKYHAHSVNSKNIIRPEDLVPENYMETVKFARVDTLPVSEQDTDIWILSDPEKQSMQQLRALLDGREGVSSSLKSDVASTRKEWNPEEDGIACPVVALPSEPTNMLKNIFLPYQPETSLQSDPNTELNVSDESHNTTSSIDIVLSKGHRHEKCFYCVTKKRPWNMFVKVRDPEEYRQKEYEECREEILKTIGILELREQVTTTRLAK
uniref:RICTOR_V domain-containing protein n=2 Tax=Bursaphelenchus xylophilus TaxID=6326 RepID=A0A1I7SCH8_BURXY